MTLCLYILILATLIVSSIILKIHKIIWVIQYLNQTMNYHLALINIMQFLVNLEMIKTKIIQANSITKFAKKVLIKS